MKLRFYYDDASARLGRRLGGFGAKVGSEGRRVEVVWDRKVMEKTC